jgi:hypothetical protein
MTIAMILELINGLISMGFNLYKMMQQIRGDEPIPTWEEILTQNITLQAKIDAEKEAL